ncbi:MAG: hypothetical protein JNM19_19885, partial [Chitinophagaceae bacterium]|nr:hypothetical protein [Chitinophagaceae bacterium]
SRTGPYYYEASTDVNATITTSGTNGDEIFAQAGSSVTMNPGFEIKAGSYFRAYIAPCNNGGIPLATRPGQNDILVPHLTEVPARAKQPASANNYFSIVNGKIEFHITGKGKIEMMGRQTDGSWKTFYPEENIYPGFYSIPAPNAFTGEIKVRLNKTDLPKL